MNKEHILDVVLFTDDSHCPTQAKVVTYLCPTCPNVHMELVVRGSNFGISFQMTDVQAEELGKTLISPHPMSKEDLRKMQG